MSKLNIKQRIALGLAALTVFGGVGAALEVKQAEPAQAWSYTNCYYWTTIKPGGSYAYSKMQTCTKNYTPAEEGHPWFYRDYKVTWTVQTNYASTPLT